MAQRPKNPGADQNPAGAAADLERLPTARHDVLRRTLLSPKGTARALGISPATLADWRYKGLYLPFIKIGAAVYYDLADIEEFLSRRKVTSAAAGRLLSKEAPPSRSAIASPAPSSNRDDGDADSCTREEN